MTSISDSTPEIVTEIYLSTELIMIPKEKIRIFALDAHTIGLSNNPPQIWIEKRLWEGEVTIFKDKEEQTIILPKEIVEFYRPKKIEIAGTIKKDNILLVVQ